MGLPLFAQTRPSPETVTFPVVPNSSANKGVQLKAQFYMPADLRRPVSAVIIAPSSGGVKAHIELHYADALADAGIAALVIDSFGSRGLTNSVRDQSVLTPFRSTNDAFGGFYWLAGDKRFRTDCIGITGVLLRSQ